MSDPSIDPQSLPSTDPQPLPSTDSQPLSSADLQPTDPQNPELTPQTSEPQPSYVKLAMRNMVRKRGTSLYHFTLTTLGLLGVLIGLAYLTR